MSNFINIKLLSVKVVIKTVNTVIPIRNKEVRFAKD